MRPQIVRDVGVLGAAARRQSLVRIRTLVAAACALLALRGTPAHAAPASRSEWTSVDGIDRRVLKLALSAASCASQAVDVKRPSLLTVIDYSRPSTQARLWVLDLAHKRQLFRELVAHGRGSGDNTPDRFSNDPGSLQSSLGLFLTGEVYQGSNGYSLRLDGLEPGVNDRARERATVMHGAPYVNPGISRTLGRLGRSWGCPALPLGIARRVIDVIKDGSLVFAYYPDRSWQQSSRFLGACNAGTRAADTD